MSQFVKITGTPRTSLGSTATRRLRNEGLVPCNVYGHKQAAATISVTSDAITSVVRSGSHVVELEVDGKSENALVKDVQWDTFSTGIIHVDFLRVDVNERVKLEVPLVLRGTPLGVLAGGALDITHHMVAIECRAIQVPDSIAVRVASLNIGDSVHARDLTELPDGVTILTPADVVLIHVSAPKKAEDAAPAEPAAS
ncbi:50S ribosomal protein L25 [Planctomicrobium sp. SH668]|uniref:50S ribosomal protein L25 n=1 Tax=Planctomicrobium sp. SH668 TaxID=3448126 RepID=UPI003F5B31DC